MSYFSSDACFTEFDPLEGRIVKPALFMPWIPNCFHFVFKPAGFVNFRRNFPGRLCEESDKHLNGASNICDIFDGLLLDASTSRGNFCGIRLEVSLYYVCYRKFSLVTLLYVQRITCGNL